MRRAILDAGALIAIDRRDRDLLALLDSLLADDVDLATSAGAVSQVWRDGRTQASLARSLAGIDCISIDERSARRAGELLAANASNDPIDAHVALLVEDGDRLITSDADDLAALLACRGTRASIVEL